MWAASKKENFSFSARHRSRAAAKAGAFAAHAPDSWLMTKAESPRARSRVAPHASAAWGVGKGAMEMR